MRDLNMETVSGLLLLERTSHFQTRGLSLIVIFSAVTFTGEGAHVTLPCPDSFKPGTNNSITCEVSQKANGSLECALLDVDFSLHLTEQEPGVWTTPNNASVCDSDVPVSGCLCVRQDSGAYTLRYSFLAYDTQLQANLSCSVTENSPEPPTNFRNVSCGSFIFESNVRRDVKDLTTVVMLGIFGMTVVVAVIVTLLYGCTWWCRRRSERRANAGASSVPMLR